jgi:Zn-dependent protease
MLISSYQLLLNNPGAFVQLTVLVVAALLVAVTIHEFSHALIATGLGDDTARRLGRLSLNPLRHLDPGGTLMLLIAGFGWGKPVPVNHERLSQGAAGVAMVAAAGPLSNLALAFLVALPVKLGLLGFSSPALGQANFVMTGGLREGLTDIVWMVIFFNLLLAVFNLIPLAPLDGSRVLGGLLPRRMMPSYNRFQQYGPAVLLTVILADVVFKLGILAGIIGPIVNGLLAAATGY